MKSLYTISCMLVLMVILSGMLFLYIQTHREKNNTKLAGYIIIEFLLFICMIFSLYF